MKRKSYALFLFRAQPVHNGHIELIKKPLKTMTKFCFWSDLQTKITSVILFQLR